MPINKLIISNFRNINSAKVLFHPKVNIIIGDNGSGKTSLLESICFLGLGRSFRTHLTNRIIHHDHQDFTLYSEISTKNKHTSIGLKKNKRGDVQLKIDNEFCKKLSKLIDYIPLQIITPECYKLLSGSPKERRAFLDWGVFYHDPLFYAHWIRLKRIIKQRNATLKQCKCYNDVQMWDNELCVLGEKISEQRQNYFDLFLPIFNSILQEFLPQFKVSSKFFCGWDITNKPLKKYLQDNFIKELQLGYTTAGPQKADIRFKIGEVPIADVLSGGQLKLFVYALRLAQGLFLNSFDNKECVFLIDDFNAELDLAKQKILAKHIINTSAQVFITVIELGHVNKLFSKNKSMFHVETGRFLELEN
ncbi:MAG: DNA replication/repair protein RecF [Psychromonas sp.]|nr:DNA replication/repair protein RecF [Psychromonas sp.]